MRCCLQVTYSCRKTDIALLSGLQSLQDFAIHVKGMRMAEQQPLSDQLVSSLTALTGLSCSCKVHNMGCLSSLRNPAQAASVCARRDGV